MKISASSAELAAVAPAGMPRVRARFLSLARPSKSSVRETVPLSSVSHCLKMRWTFDSYCLDQLGLVR